jgi:hypothetical protein
MRILLALLFVVAVAACSKKKDDGAPTPSPASGTKPAEPAPTDPAPDEKPTPTEPDKPAATGTPTKEAGIARLKETLAALEAKDYTKAAGFFVLPAGVPADKIAGELGRLLELKEISAPGIEILATKGKWGKLAEVFEPERAQRWAEKSGVAVDQCWGFSAEGSGANASVGFHYDGKELKLIRLNNVGKL